MTADIKRYELFCQLRANIRGSNGHLLVGIDIAKDKHHAFFGTPTGKTLWRRLLFRNDVSGFQQLIEQVDLLTEQYKLNAVVFGLEPTGNYHKPLAHWLIAKGYMVVLVLGKAVKDNRQLLDGRWDKNDCKDSANAADLISQGKCQFYEQPDENILAVRNLLSIRKRLKKAEHSQRMQIRNGLLAKYFPEMDQYWKNSLQENLAIVRQYLDPRKIAATKFEKFVVDVTSNSRGGRRLSRLKSIHDAAKDSVGLAVDSSTVFEAQLLVDNLIRTMEQVDDTMKQIQLRCQEMPGYQLLLTIPGFGPYITALVLASIGNPHRFSCAGKVLRLAGLDLNANRSGKKSDASVPKISKRGDADLRYGLFQAAQVASYHNKIIARLFARMLHGRAAERGIKFKMRIKLAAKFIVIAWTMLKNNEAFDVSRLAGATRSSTLKIFDFRRDDKGSAAIFNDHKVSGQAEAGSAGEQPAKE
jgi:transposase